jgi:2',3'-cyclic-nucleotide 2'-phosphodiesterase (5'-nucleotidase family)
MWPRAVGAVAITALVAGGAIAQRRVPPPDPPLITLSIVGTTDLHGAALPTSELGGLPLLAGYVNNLRRARAADGGAVLLVDSGDTFQGGIESSLSEGALVVDAYNTMGYTAQAIGNHDFDFGSVDNASSRQTAGDLRGAIKARAAQARFPFLAANLIDEATGRAVDWPNVHPGILVDTAGVKVGIIGVLTVDAFQSTIAANVQGLRAGPLDAAIVTEATKLRRQGAEVVVVAAHAGGRCTRFDDAADLSSCDSSSEIFRLAARLPPGLVDVVAAGHTHAGVAHRVNGIAIIESYSHGQAFGRVDVVLSRATRAISRIDIFAPRSLCTERGVQAGSCVGVTDRSGSYESQPVVEDASIARAMDAELQRVHRLQATTYGASLAASVPRTGTHGSPLGDVFADAIRHALPGADAAVVNNASRGLWADLPKGPLTFGSMYNVFPFDNRIARITISGADLIRWVRDQIQDPRRGALGISGLMVRATCGAEGLRVDLFRADGGAVRDDEQLLVATIGGPTLSGSVATADPLGGGPPENSPVVREVVEDWVAQTPLTLERVGDAARERIERSNAVMRGCR